jgi:hypothetical protein
VRCLLFRFISLILGVGELPNSEQSKFQEAAGFVLRDYFNRVV